MPSRDMENLLKETYFLKEMVDCFPEKIDGLPIYFGMKDILSSLDDTKSDSRVIQSFIHLLLRFTALVFYKQYYEVTMGDIKSFLGRMIEHLNNVIKGVDPIEDLHNRLNYEKERQSSKGIPEELIDIIEKLFPDPPPTPPGKRNPREDN